MVDPQEKTIAISRAMEEPGGCIVFCRVFANAQNSRMSVFDKIMFHENMRSIRETLATKAVGDSFRPIR